MKVLEIGMFNSNRILFSISMNEEDSSMEQSPILASTRSGRSKMAVMNTV
jgi:hypothetical protein